MSWKRDKSNFLLQIKANWLFPFSPLLLVSIPGFIWGSPCAAWQDKRQDTVRHRAWTASYVWKRGPSTPVHLARNSRFQLEIDGSGEYPCVAVRAGALTEADCTDPCGVLARSVRQSSCFLGVICFDVRTNKCCVGYDFYLWIYWRRTTLPFENGGKNGKLSLNAPCSQLWPVDKMRLSTCVEWIIHRQSTSVTLPIWILSFKR